MAWIESHQSLGGHIKLRRLARMLGIHRAQAVGHLHYIWWWALDGAPSGDLSGLAPAEIAELAEWPGDPEPFVTALRECGWIDSDGRIHDWQEYAGRLVDVRRKDRERKRTVRRTSSGIPADGGRTADVPNPTQPNPTVPYRERVRTPDPPTGETPTHGSNPDLAWPTIEEARQRAEARGIPRDCAEKWWHLNDSRGGCDAHGQPIRRWESSLIAFAATWRSVEDHRKAIAASKRPLAAPTELDHSKGF
ncbi:MAG TPA: hypothetical protein PKM73_20410 [Verrucomicrobiota bacterium]|nr:hypothetical protein [Verrucomicrobiota bacterium]